MERSIQKVIEGRIGCRNWSTADKGAAGRSGSILSELFEGKMEHKDLMVICKGIKDKIEPVRNRVTNPVRSGNNKNIHPLPARR
jgi:hypothetical protein